MMDSSGKIQAEIIQMNAEPRETGGVPTSLFLYHAGNYFTRKSRLGRILFTYI